MRTFKKGSIRKTIKRELIRALLERSQGIDLKKMSASTNPAAEIRYDDVEETLNLPYINREEVPLAMDIFKPVTEEGKELPVIVTIHGGGLTLGDRHISRAFSRLLAHKGYLVFSVEYRLAPRANVCQQLDDVCAGLDLVGKKLVDFDVDFSRIFMAAESAGAYLALYVAAMKDSVMLQNAIGHEPSRMRFKALYLNCGMFYTTRSDPCGWMLSEQIFGDKRVDENFLQYMNPEHPEIISNLPPVMFTTSRGDFLNNYSIMLCDAMKKAGKPCQLIYYPDEKLSHAFMTLQTYHPINLECTDKMLAFFEEQAKRRTEKDPELEKRRKKLNTRLNNGNIVKQSVGKCVREIISAEPSKMRLTALIDCTREYTYEQMFEEWDRYAKVFAALGITGEEHARAGIAGTISAEPLFAFYGLNMVGAQVSMLSFPDFMPGGKWRAMLKTEKITDLIISDIIVTPDFRRELVQAAEELGLRHIILLHTKLGGPCTGPAELIFNEFNHQALRQQEGTVFMQDLLAKYADTPLPACKDDCEQIALITHTSGTTRGTRKPLPYTNRTVNQVALSYLKGGRANMSKNLRGQLRIAPCFDFSSFLNMGGLINASFAAADTVVLTFFGFLHPKFVRAVKYYQLNMVYCSGFMLDKWMQMDDEQIDFSSVSIFGCGGSYIPTEKLKQYNQFIQAHGCRYGITRGYGMSETGGSDIRTAADDTQDVLGKPADPENLRIQDENDQQFYMLADGPRTGILYIHSETQCCNTLDGEVLFAFQEIDGRDYVCTNDLVCVNEDGSLSYAGRADRYFVNNEGVRFDPGILEVRLAAQAGIKQCAVVPVLEKRIHDTVPVLYAIPEQPGENAAETIRQALLNVFVTEDGLPKNELPVQFVVTDSIPCNSNGKIDIFRITRERLNGIAYNITPVTKDDALTDIQIEKAEQLSTITGGSLPEGMGEAASLDLYELLNTPAAAVLDPFDPLSPQRVLEQKLRKMKEKPFKPPQKLMDAAQNLVGKLYQQKTFDHYFEI